MIKENIRRAVKNIIATVLVLAMLGVMPVSATAA